MRINFGWLRRSREGRHDLFWLANTPKGSGIYGFNPKIVAIADIDAHVINPRGLSPEKLDAIKQKGYPISADPEFGHPKCQR
jgi:hypothetical protein